MPPPPWHFSGDALGIDFRADPAAVAAVLPAGLEPLGDGSARSCSATGRRRPTPTRGSSPTPPGASTARPTSRCNATLDGTKVARVPYIWVDNDLSFARGHIQGFPKKMGTIAITRAVTVGSRRAEGRGRRALRRPRRQPGPQPRARRGDARGAGRRRASCPRALRTPDLAHPLRARPRRRPPLVHDLARNLRDRLRVADVWHGPGQLELLDSEFEEHAALAPLEVTGGFRCAVAFTITGAEVRPG